MQSLREMWSNKSKKIHSRSANIKGYLGGFQGLDVDADEIDYNSNSHAKGKNVRSCPVPRTQSLVSVLVEIPEDLDTARFPSRYEQDGSRFNSPTSRMNQHLKEQQFGRQSSNTNRSAAVAEIGNNLMDIDNYMLSVFHMNDDASVYTKATTDASLSSSNSSSSTASTRRRHRGAFRMRKKGIRRNDDSLEKCNNMNRNGKGYNWMESMKKSSMNIFVDGEDAWTPSKGWHIANDKTVWDLKPDGHWNDRHPIFDSIKKERLEI